MPFCFLGGVYVCAAAMFFAVCKQYMEFCFVLFCLLGTISHAGDVAGRGFVIVNCDDGGSAVSVHARYLLKHTCRAAQVTKHGCACRYCTRKTCYAQYPHHNIYTYSKYIYIFFQVSKSVTKPAVSGAVMASI